MGRQSLILAALTVAVLSVSVPGQQPATQSADEAVLLRAEVKMLQNALEEKTKQIEKLQAENKALAEQVKQVPSGGSRATTAPVSQAALYEKYKQKYAMVDGKFVRLPDFDLRFQSSRKVAPFPASGPTTYAKKALLAALPAPGNPPSPKPRGPLLGPPVPIPGDTPERRKMLTESNTAEYELGLPNLRIGEFGVIYAKVFQVLGEDEMLITGIVDRDRRREVEEAVVRLKGWPTKGLVDGAVWTGGAAIIGTWQYTGTTGAGKTIYNAIPLDQVRAGLTADQFAQMLKTGVDPEKENK